METEVNTPAAIPIICSILIDKCVKIIAPINDSPRCDFRFYDSTPLILPRLIQTDIT